MSTPATDRKWDIFISYASEDVGEARWLREQMSQNGWRCFAASEDLNLLVGTSEWSEVIDRSLDEAPVLVLIATPEALASKWVNYEWRSVHDSILSGREGLLIPICFRGLAPQDLPRALRRYQCVDCRDLGTRAARLRGALDLLAGYFAPEGAAQASAPPLGVPRGSRRRGLAVALWVGTIAAGLLVASATITRIRSNATGRETTGAAQQMLRRTGGQTGRPSAPCNCPPGDPLCRCPPRHPHDGDAGWPSPVQRHHLGVVVDVRRRRGLSDVATIALAICSSSVSFAVPAPTPNTLNPTTSPSTERMASAVAISRPAGIHHRWTLTSSTPLTRQTSWRTWLRRTRRGPARPSARTAA